MVQHYAVQSTNTKTFLLTLITAWPLTLSTLTKAVNEGDGCVHVHMYVLR